MKPNFKKQLDELAIEALCLTGSKSDYSDDDLLNATIVLMEVLSNKMFDYHKDKLSNKQMKELATEMGNGLRQSLILFAGVDMHEVCKKKKCDCNL